MKILSLLPLFLLVCLAGACRETSDEAAPAASEPARTVTLPEVEVTNSDFLPGEVEEGSTPAGETPMTIADEEVGRTSTISPAPAGAGAPPAPAPAGGSAPEGARIFAAYECDACHGPAGRGGTPRAASLGIEPLGSATVQAKSDAELIRIILEGNDPQSAAAHREKNLRPEDAALVVQWLRTLD